MTATTLLWLLGVFIGGVLLALWGARGKRLNDHPTCRDCGFDLSAVPEGCITCPECGAGLRRARAVRIGQRRRRYGAIALGVLVAALPVLTVGAVGFAVVTGTDLNAYKPVGLLLWEGRGHDAARVEAAVSELLTRMQGSKLSDAQQRTVVAAAFEAQADAARPWCAAWGDVLDRARLDDLLTDEDEARYRTGAAVLEFRARPRVRAGDELPVVVTLKDARIGKSAVLTAQAMLADARMDGKKLKRPRPPTLTSWLWTWGAALPEPNMHVGWFYLIGPGNRWQQQSYGGARIVFSVPKDAAPGPRTVEVELQVRTEPQTQGTFTWNNELEPDHPNVRMHRSSMAVEVLPADAAAIELVEPTPELRDKLESVLRPRQSHAYLYDSGAGSAVYGTHEFSMEGLPVPVAFDVVWRSGDREWPMGTLTSGTTAEEGAYAYGSENEESMRSVSFSPPLELRDKPIELVLRPNPAVAQRTVDVFRIYNGEIVFEDIDVQWTDQTGSGGSGSRSWIRSLLLGG